MLLFTGKGLTEIQPQTPCFSFTSTSPQLLKFNSVCYLRRGLGKRTHHEKKNGPSKEQKENNPPPNTSLQDRVNNVSSGLLFWEKGERSEDKHTHTHLDAAGKTKSGLEGLTPNKIGFLNFSGGISPRRSTLSYVFHTSASLSINRCRAQGNREERPTSVSWEPKMVWTSDPGWPRPQPPIAFLVKERIYPAV